MQRSHALAARQLRVALACERMQRVAVGHCHDGIDAGIEPVDLMQKGIEDLRAGHFTAVNGGAKRCRAEIRDI